MKSLLSSRPVLWFLFLFNLVVAVAAYFVVDGPQGLMTSVGMGVVSLGAGVGLLKRLPQPPPAPAAPPTPDTDTDRQRPTAWANNQPRAYVGRHRTHRLDYRSQTG